MTFLHKDLHKRLQESQLLETSNRKRQIKLRITTRE